MVKTQKEKTTYLSSASESHCFVESKSIDVVFDYGQYVFYAERLTVLYISLNYSSHFWSVDIDLDKYQ